MTGEVGDALCHQSNLILCAASVFFVLLVFSKIYGIFAHNVCRFSAAVMAVLSCEGAGKKAGFRRLARFFCEKCGARARGIRVIAVFL